MSRNRRSLVNKTSSADRTWQQNANATGVGTLTFQPQFTAQLTANAQGQLVREARTGSSFGDFLLGLPATGQMIPSVGRQTCPTDLMRPPGEPALLQ